MDRQSLSELFWVENADSKLPRCGCYITDPKIKSYFPEPVSVPLKHIKYDVQIIDSIARVQLTQTYVNPLSDFLEVEYSFPLDPNSCLYKFHVKFGDTLLVGHVKEKEEAREEYKQALQQGRQVAYGQIDNKSKDIINIRIGNIPAKEPVEIVIEFALELEVSLCTFWKFTAYSTISPRYLNDKPTSTVNIESTNPTGPQPFLLSPAYTWSFQVAVRSSKPITFCNSTSHQLVQLSMAIDKKDALFELEKISVPNRDFIFLYSTENIGSPGCVVGSSDVGMSAVMSFVPRFSKMQTNDAYSMFAKGKSLEYDMQTTRGEYIFLLDRSGSMQGVRIEKARQALLFFLKSLPQDSYFQIYSFGDSYFTLFAASSKYDDSNITSAVNKVSAYEANMGGTEIEQPLSAVFNTPVIPNYPKQVFLLTDGDVNNTDRVIKLVKDNTHFGRVHAIGIGNGCSPALIKGCAEKGKGKHIFIQNNQNVSAKIIELLNAVMSPALTHFSFKYDPQMVEAVIPNPKQMPYVLKDEPVNIYVLFKPGATGNFGFDISYLSSVTNSIFFSTHNVDLTKEQQYPFIDKMAHFKALGILADAIEDKKKLTSDIALSEVGDLTSYVNSQSMRHQVLCRLTAFICVEQKLIDGKYQQYTNSKLTKIVVPEHEPEDQHASPWGQFLRKRKCQGVTKSTLKETSRVSQVFCGPPPPGFSCDNPSTISKGVDPESDTQSNLSPWSAFLRKKKWYAASRLPVSGVGIAPTSQAVDNPSSPSSSSSRSPTSSKLKIVIPPKQISALGQPNCVSAVETHIPKPVNSLDRLVYLQKVDGSWNSIEVLQLIGVEKSKFQQLLQQFEQDDLLLTILVSAYLTKYHNLPEYLLILKKCKSWVNKTLATRNINASLVVEAEAIIN